MNNIRIGFIGAGFQGKDLIRRIGAKTIGVKVTAISDINDSNATEAAELYGLKKYEDGIELIRSPEIDAVGITSWGETHEEYVLEAIKCNKPVFCEKPLATTKEGCQRIVEAEIAAGQRLVQLGYMRRFDAQYNDLRQVIMNGTLGSMMLMHCAHRNTKVNERYSSGMVVTDMIVHEIDIIRWLTRQEIIAVQTVVPKRSKHANAHAISPQFYIFQLADHTIVDVEANPCAHFGYEIKCEIVGEDGVASLSQMNNVTMHLANEKREYIPTLWTERFDQAYDREMQTWVESLRKGTVTGPSSFDGFMASLCTEACLKALESGNRIEIEKFETPGLYKTLEQE